MSISFKNGRIAWFTGIVFALATLLYFSSSHIQKGFSSVTSPFATGHIDAEAVLPAIPSTLTSTKSRYAFVTLLGKDAVHNETDINSDVYFASMRTLGWSLLHAKESKSIGIPFVVLAVPGVNPAKIARLEKDGAIVYQVEPVPTPDWLPYNNHREWQDVWAKLRLWELEQFEKVLFLDADIIVARNLDIIFETTLTQKSDMAKAEGIDHPDTIPLDYVFCAGIETSVNHHFPPLDEELEKGQYVNGGVFVARPSKAMFDHYMAVMNTPNSFTTITLEQDLLNRVHRKDGAMPFQQLPWEYLAYRPTKEDVDGGALAYHAKFWSLDHKELTPYMESFRWRAIGWYDAWDESREA